MAGATRTWRTKREKLWILRRFASETAMAVDGVVVSKPTAKKTTSFSGCSSAIRSASRGLKRALTSPP